MAEAGISLCRAHGRAFQNMEPINVLKSVVITLEPASFMVVYKVRSFQIHSEKKKMKWKSLFCFSQ